MDPGTRLDDLGQCDRPLSGTSQPANHGRCRIISYMVLEFCDFFIVGIIFL